ncbi:TMV resistance protein N-like isoform X2 [Vigna unguiculata]|uniref:TMV resistance protein N-like isoform X2 n=1 Tax=Vigna unguiculata TaxID=3917 RepID=UPI0010161510|nr:TMV resistance protein N-like isoform X2 [Vigna unguiculata]
MVEQRIMSVVPSSSNSCTKKYDVFISYRGKDTRKNFSTHLYEALMQKKVETYVDEDIEKDPSHVRNQTGRFMESFVKHEGEPNCIKWKTALTQAANLAGWSSQNYRTDSELLKDIVEDVLEKLPPRCRNQCKGWWKTLHGKPSFKQLQMKKVPNAKQQRK